tara:strand:- start:1109 stop:1501 length:393 start_codon:yes stop_codon:yes gene_type:complete
MNTTSLEWFRGNVKYTEESGLVYFDMINIGGRQRFIDKISATGLKFFGTPAEFGARHKPSKYISVVSSPDKGKAFYVDYPKNDDLTKVDVFPGGNGKDKLNTNFSPYHAIKLYFPGRTSLSLNNNTKSWS